MTRVLPGNLLVVRVGLTIEWVSALRRAAE